MLALSSVSYLLGIGTLTDFPHQLQYDTGKTSKRPCLLRVVIFIVTHGWERFKRCEYKIPFCPIDQPQPTATYLLTSQESLGVASRSVRCEQASEIFARF